MTETVTGQGRLKLGGVTISMEFTVPAGPCSATKVLPGMQNLANQVTAFATAGVEAAGLRISCQKGCGACCR